MKKIMFNTPLGLEQAVIDGRKPMTRRFLNVPKRFHGVDAPQLEFHRNANGMYFDCVLIDDNGHELGQLPLPYEVGEIVAIAQSYKSIIRASERDENVSRFLIEKGLMTSGGAINCDLCTCAGYGNKMFVRAEYMPYRILITDLWFERLQDISEEDCMKEGIFLDDTAPSCYHPFYTFQNSVIDETPVGYKTPRLAFASLIDKVSGRGTWDSNSWVVAYTFERITNNK
jgi:hypothetical protein